MPGTSSLRCSSMAGPPRRFHSSTVVCSCFQTPDRSGLPSAVRGVAAVRSGLPSGVRGVPGIGKFNHCADVAVERRANRTRNNRTLAFRPRMSSPFGPADTDRNHNPATTHCWQRWAATFTARRHALSWAAAMLTALSVRLMVENAAVAAIKQALPRSMPGPDGPVQASRPRTCRHASWHNPSRSAGYENCSRCPPHNRLRRRACGSVDPAPDGRNSRTPDGAPNLAAPPPRRQTANRTSRVCG